MLQITEQQVSPTQVVCGLAGEITLDQIPRLEGLVRSVLASGKDLTLDVSGVWRVDRPVTRLIAQFCSCPGSRVHLEGVDQGLLAWLRDVAGEDG
jgi:ABC-type transporter Mla MlaB component